MRADLEQYFMWKKVFLPPFPPPQPIMVINVVNQHHKSITINPKNKKKFVPIANLTRHLYVSFQVQSLISFLHSSKSFEKKLLNTKLYFQLPSCLNKPVKKALESCNLKFESWIYDIETNIEKKMEKSILNALFYYINCIHTLEVQWNYFII